ncbi:MAG: hypothetical protein Q4F85_02820 [Prevotella sp.]|nr:hypothetical protein [Prevotella sp.]
MQIIIHQAKRLSLGGLCSEEWRMDSSSTSSSTLSTRCGLVN